MHLPADIQRVAADDPEDDGQEQDESLEVESETRVRSFFVGKDGELYAVNDVRGGELDPQKVIAARDEEIGYIIRRSDYKPSKAATCHEVTGVAPIEVGWSDTNKGDKYHPHYISTMVGK